MQLRIPDLLLLKRLRVRADFLLAAVVSAVVVDVYFAFSLSAVIFLHEFSHALMAARLVHRRLEIVLQLGGGGGYLGSGASSGRQIAILLAGPMSAGLSGSLAWLLMSMPPSSETVATLAARLWQATWVWTVFQASPIPVLDGGGVLRILSARWIKSATWRWSLCWLLGGLFAVLLILVLPTQIVLVPTLWLLGLAVLLGRSEAGHVRHVDAFEAWERQDYREVIRRARRVPDGLALRDRQAIIELGLLSALEIGEASQAKRAARQSRAEPVGRIDFGRTPEVSAIQDFAVLLPAAHPATVRAAGWLLRQEQPLGAQIGQRALDALDAETVKPNAGEQESFAELAFRFAVFESNGGRSESALGLLEKAIALGWRDLDRLELELGPLMRHPRWNGVVGSLAASVREVNPSGR